MLWIVLWLAIGVGISYRLCRKLHIYWDSENIVIKLFVVFAVPLWPLALIFVAWAKFTD